MRFIGVLILVIGVSNSIFSQSPITASIPFEDSYASGNYLIYKNLSTYTTNLSTLRKPIIFVEGFDANGDYGIDPNNSDPEVIDIYRMLNYQSNLISALHIYGYDIIILNFNNGGDKIQRNAMLLIELINRVNQYKPTNDQLIVIGYSMGGLVARYALTYMENQSVDHETRLYISFDALHQGAHIPASVQSLVKGFEDYANLFPLLAEQINSFNCPAAEQMLKYRLSDPTQIAAEIPISEEFIEFYDELNALNECQGYPGKSRNVAISLGSWTGIPQLFNFNCDGLDGPDWQHSGFPVLYINFETSGSDIPIWQMNPCDIAAIATFQAYLSTIASDNYPYYSERYDFCDAELEDDMFATWWYYPGINPFLPWGAYSRVWTYGPWGDGIALDFAPGSFSPIYAIIATVVNSQIQYSHNYADNATYISTVSAFDYDTEDLFLDIQNDPYQLTRTPFDRIIGIDGNNTSHIDDQLDDPDIVTFILDEVQHNYGKTCLYNNDLVTGIIDPNEIVEEGNGLSLTVSNLTIGNGATVNLKAGETITLTNNISTGTSVILNLNTGTCVQKTCPNNY